MAPSASFIDVEPPTVIGPATKKAMRPSSELPQSLIQGAKVAKREAFNPPKHLNFHPPKTIYTMEQIGLNGHGISPHAATEPFPLFTQEAIAQMRAEISDEKVLAECQYSSTFNRHMIRGMGPASVLLIHLTRLTTFLTTNRRAPFTYDAWKSPEAIARISEVAGIDLVPSIDFEIANINISIGDESISSDAEQTKKINYALEDEKRTPLCRVALRQLSIRLRSHALRLHWHGWRRNSVENTKWRDYESPRPCYGKLPPSIPLIYSAPNILCFARVPPSSSKADTSSTKPSRPSVAANASAWSLASDRDHH
ncbi:hypothetical protein BDW75DRAFT_201037 [Aspergillus navahoensis]